MATLHIVTTVNSSPNKVRIDLFKGGTLVESKPPQVFPHPVTIWTFENLIPSEVYEWQHVELDSSNNIIKTYSKILVTVPATGSVKVRGMEDIIVGVTPGFNPDVFTYVIDGRTDGSGTRPDFRTWDINIFESGTGPLQKDVAYTWNKDTGNFTRLDRTFILGERYTVQFEPKITANLSVTVKDAWGSTYYITDDVTLVADDWGKNAIVTGADGYLKITLPPIVDVPPNKLWFVEVPDGVTKCVELTCNPASGNGNLIMWPTAGRNSLRLCKSESIAVYRERVDNTTSHWRFKHPDGNFKYVGKHFYSFADGDDYINAVECNGQELDELEYARLLNDHVLQHNNHVPYALWFGTNRQKFSDVGPNGKFHVPDLTNLTAKTVDILNLRKPGDFRDQAVGYHYHGNGIGDDFDVAFVYGAITSDMPGLSKQGITTDNSVRTRQGKTSGNFNLVNGIYVQSGTGQENEVKSYGVRTFILV